jgi:hypothetical protein
MQGKVADFGLSRGFKDAENENSDYYRARGNTPIPVRWTAPEALDTNKFSTSSDVWGFGIMIVELYANAAKGCLYPGLKNAVVMQKVVGGYQHPRPAGCNTEMHELLLKCWSFEPSERPTFDAIVEVLEFNWKREDGSVLTTAATLEIVDQDGYDMPSNGAATAPITTVEHVESLSEVRRNSQLEPGYQYAKALNPAQHAPHTTALPTAKVEPQVVNNAASVTLPPLEYETPLSLVRINSQSEPGYQYAQTPASQQANDARFYTANPDNINDTIPSSGHVVHDGSADGSTGTSAGSYAAIPDQSYQFASASGPPPTSSPPHTTPASEPHVQTNPSKKKLGKGGGKKGRKEHHGAARQPDEAGKLSTNGASIAETSFASTSNSQTTAVNSSNINSEYQESVAALTNLSTAGDSPISARSRLNTGERCPRCKAKVQVCTCNVRQNHPEPSIATRI